jgi:hypothetical protein
MNGDIRKNWLLGQTAIRDPELFRYCFITGFQGQVNVQPAPGVEGDFCSFNSGTRNFVNVGPGGLVTGPNGATVGRFAWYSGVVDSDGTPTQVSTSFTGAQLIAGGGTFPGPGSSSQMVVGFIHREQQALITVFLSDATLVVPQGFPITVATGGDFWAKNRGTTTAQIGQKAYANFADGSIYFANSGNPIQSANITGSIAPALSTITASIAGNILTVTALASGTLTPGTTLTGTGGGTIATGTTITGQLSGSTGQVGIYTLNIPEQTYTSATINGSAGLLTAATLVSGTLGVGATISGTGAAAGTYITALGTGTGGTGTYYVYPSQTEAAVQTMLFLGSIETKWQAMSNGLVGELVKMSSEHLG